MSSRTWLFLRQGVAAVLALLVLSIDLRAGFDVSIAVLYAIVLLVAAFGQSPRLIRLWMTSCGVLALGSFLCVHWSDPDLGSVLRLLFSLVAVAITGALLIGRHKLESMRTEVEHSREELQIFADSVPQVLWATYPDGRCYFLSRQFTEFTGVSREAAIREQNWTDTIHPEDRLGFLAEMEEAYRTETDFRTYFRVRSRDGDYYWMYWMAAPHRLPETGRVHRWYGGCANVDSQFKAQETIRQLNHTLEQRVEQRTEELVRAQWRYRSLFQDRNIGVLELSFTEAKAHLDILRKNGVKDLHDHFVDHPDDLEQMLLSVRILDLNETYRSMLGFSDAPREELLEPSPGENRLGGRPVLIRTLHAYFNLQDSIAGTANIRTRTGSLLVVAYAINLSESGTAFFTVVDITERERAHELLLKAQNEMARASRVATIGALSVSLAHELNQPIASMSMDAATVLRELKKPDSDRDRMAQIVDRLSRNTMRLAAIVDRTRNRVSGRERTLAPLDLCTLARETASLLERDAAARGATLHVHCSGNAALVEADPVEIQQVLVNLTMNALDAMSDQTLDASRVDIAVTGTGEDRVRVSVSDSGPGIPDDQIEQIFQPFYTTKPDGVGMGLQICRWTIEALGGDLAARNRPEGGAEFEFTLMSL